MKAKIVLIITLIACLLVVSSCSVDTTDLETDTNASGSSSSSSSSGSSSGDGAAGIGSEDDSGEKEMDSYGPYDLDDFLGATNIVPYTGEISEDYTYMKSTLSEYWGNEEDVSRSTSYNFEAIRVDFGDAGSVFYLISLDGSFSYSYESSTDDLDGDWDSETTGSYSDSFSYVATSSDTPSKIGSIDENGELSVSIFPGFYVDDLGGTFLLTTTSGGEVETRESSTSIPGLSFGGGNDEVCGGGDGDNSISGPSTCKIIVGDDMSNTGSHQDSTYTELANGFTSSIQTTTWSLTPMGE